MPTVSDTDWRCPYCNDTMNVAWRNSHITRTCREIAKVFNVRDERHGPQ